MQRQYITKIYTVFKSMIPKMSFVQNDTNVNRIQFEFYDDVNEPMTDIFDATAVIKRPDTNSYTFGSDAFEIDGNVVTLILPPAAVYLSGEYTAKVSVYDNNYGRLSTQTFTYSVTAELTSNTPIDQTNEYPVLTKLIADTQDVKNTTESNYQNALNSSASIATLEVVDARKGEANLGAKIAKIDSSLAEYAHIVNVKHEGVKGDGTDETVKVQAALDKAVTQHGVFYIPSDMTVVVDQIKVDNKSNFKIVIDGTLKRKANARCYENSGIGDVWALLRISQCTDFDIPSFHGDGNIAQNPTARPDINETQHILHLSQCDRVHLGNIVGKNPGGDVVLIGYCHDVQCDNIYGYGNNVGRQTLSIYDGERMQFANIISIGVGMELMPGGIDLEPESNPNGDPPRVIRDIQFGNVYIESAADGCLALQIIICILVKTIQFQLLLKIYQLTI
jgi:hypothetical protein